MTKQQLDRWRTTRTRGRRRFVIERALLLSSLTAVVASIFSWCVTNLLHIPTTRYGPLAFAGGTIVPMLVIGWIAGGQEWARREREFLAAQNCGDCGYSLTGNTSGRCPECGQPVLRTNKQ